MQVVEMEMGGESQLLCILIVRPAELDQGCSYFHKETAAVSWDSQTSIKDSCLVMFKL